MYTVSLLTSGNQIVHAYITVPGLFLFNVKKIFKILILCIKVQCQLFCTWKRYCDFIVWMENDMNVERIYPDEIIRQVEYSKVI